MRLRRGHLLIGASALLVAIALAAPAWACTNFIRIDQITAADVAGVSTSTVHGSGASSNATVELLWNGTGGPVIGRGQADASGVFSADVTVPDVPAGLYTIIASDGKTPIGRAAYQVGTGDVVNAPTTSVSAGAGNVVSWAPRAGIGILAVGLVLLAAGTCAGSARRRRALALA